MVLGRKKGNSPLTAWALGNVLCLKNPLSDSPARLSWPCLRGVSSSVFGRTKIVKHCVVILTSGFCSVAMRIFLSEYDLCERDWDSGSVFGHVCTPRVFSADQPPHAVNRTLLNGLVSSPPSPKLMLSPFIDPYLIFSVRG